MEKKTGEEFKCDIHNASAIGTENFWYKGQEMSCKLDYPTIRIENDVYY